MSPPSLLDALMPEYEHSERHATLINASTDAVWRAVREVQPREIRLFLLLTAIRGLGRRRTKGKDMALLDVARAGNFFDLAENESELVLGTIGQFWRLRPGGAQRCLDRPENFGSFSEPGYAKAAINFRVLKEGSKTRLTTETRITTTDAWARRRFAMYWRIIHPGSALIRRMWLQAIRRRAERSELL